MHRSSTIIGLGELLWDILPTGPQLGGAPANFSYCSHLLGNHAVIASRIAADRLGREAIAHLQRSGLTDQALQIDSDHPTGTVRVRLDSTGQPSFEIANHCAWDFLTWTANWRELARSADAVCFGTLAQRSAQSGQTVAAFLDATPPGTLRVFDVNLRQNFYSAEIIRQSLRRATVVKLNDEEAPRIGNVLGIASSDPLNFCHSLLSTFALKLVCITRGANGSLLCDGGRSHEHPGFEVEDGVQPRDTIGAGDAFTAGLVYEFLRGSQLEEMNDQANRMGAWVASHSGAMPSRPASGLNQALSKLRPKENAH